jgi:hypothetical protein
MKGLRVVTTGELKHFCFGHQMVTEFNRLANRIIFEPSLAMGRVRRRWGDLMRIRGGIQSGLPA